MKFRTLGRHIREGFKNVGRNGWMTFASVVSMVFTLFILGVFLILAFNVDFIAGNLERQVEIRALVDHDATERDIQEIDRQLQQISGIENITFKEKKVVLDEFIAGLGEEGNPYEGLLEENNPLPHTYEIQTINPQEAAEVTEQIENIENVYKVDYGGEATETLFSAMNIIRTIGTVLIIGLAFTAMLLISNTIKVTIAARRTEIEIMKLVGATNAFVRWPFFIEGLILGAIGALIPAVVLIFGYDKLIQISGQYIDIPFITFLPTFPFVYQVTLLLFGIGIVLGIWGSMISVRRFLRV